MMACRAAGHWSSALVQGRGCCLKPNAKSDFCSYSLSWRPRKMMAVGSRRISCCGALPLAPKEERIDDGYDDGDRMAEIRKSLLAMTPFREPIEVGREEVVGPPPPSISTENLDRWVQESVMEIVRNIQEAPFFVCLYTKKKGAAMKLDRELVAAQDRNWPLMKRWVGEKRLDGIILVEELKGDMETTEEESASKCSQLWGLLIQGRGIDCAACYILKTTRICSTLGLCTHFCLIRAKCYSDPVEVQLKNSWLNFEL